MRYFLSWDRSAGSVLCDGSDSVGAAVFPSLANSPFLVSKCNWSHDLISAGV